MRAAAKAERGGGGGVGGGMWLVWLVVAVSWCSWSGAEQVRDLEVSEGAPVGTRVGYIGDGGQGDSGPPYLIVPVPGSAVDSELAIEQATGEIRTRVPLDRETRSSYSLVAIPNSGQNIRVVVRVLDENDNAPTFPSPLMHIEFPENTPRDVKRTLDPARDLDLGVYNTQRYNIVSGNLNNAFRLSSHRERDGVLYLDLQINGFLDRETTSAYSLVIEALDGGNPPLRGSMTVNITIQDVNDNQPIFNQSRYFASIPENTTVGTSVLQVFATDTDANENGQVEYSINRRQSDKEGFFRIDPKTGLVAVNRALDFETKEVHELVVVAKDRGAQPLETTAFVSIRVTDVNDNRPTINVIFLSDDATPKISERAKQGEFVARISVDDPDSKTEYSNVNVTLEGGEGHFGLTTQDNIIYLVIVRQPIDREETPNYTLSVIATDQGTPPLHASRTFHLRVIDVNDNSPVFSQMEYHADVLEVAAPGTSVLRVAASDRDEGANSELTFSLRETSHTHSGWFQIDSRTGLITTKAHIDCETDPVPRLSVIATDSGSPSLSSSAIVLVTIHDVNDNEPIFDQSFYNVTVPENEPKGRCILKRKQRRILQTPTGSGVEVTTCDVGLSLDVMTKKTVLESEIHTTKRNSTEFRNKLEYFKFKNNLLKKREVESCCVLGCKAQDIDGSGLQFFRFPKMNFVKNRWIKAIQRPDFEPQMQSVICSQHFLESDYVIQLGSDTKRLKKNAVPSIFRSSPSHLQPDNEDLQADTSSDEQSVSKDFIFQPENVFDMIEINPTVYSCNTHVPLVGKRVLGAPESINEDYISQSHSMLDVIETTRDQGSQTYGRDWSKLELYKKQVIYLRQDLKRKEIRIKKMQEEMAVMKKK